MIIIYNFIYVTFYKINSVFKKKKEFFFVCVCER